MPLPGQEAKAPRRNDERTIIHFFIHSVRLIRVVLHPKDYDCFYAAVFENENPALKSVPLKQIIVTCNYVARQRGLRKLQLVTEAKRIVPEVVIVLGEELGRFRDVSKTLYHFLKSFSWCGRAERLGFDEVFLDVSDIVNFNQALLNPEELQHSFFRLNRDDSTVGFAYDATIQAGHSFPAPTEALLDNSETSVLQRLTLGSHLAQHLRTRMEDETGYTATAGISTNKLLAKLVGSLNKPRGQTTLLPPYIMPPIFQENLPSNVIRFIDRYEISKIPGVGLKSSQRIRSYVTSLYPSFSSDLPGKASDEAILVRDVRNFPGMGPEVLERVLGGPGAERGIGGKVWGLLHGVDNSIVKNARQIPHQISMENTYLCLKTMPEVHHQLSLLAMRLIKRMHIDLLENCEDSHTGILKKWIALPKTVRLSTRARPTKNSGTTQAKSYSRVSRSCPCPNFIFELDVDIGLAVERLVEKTLIPLFKKLHPKNSEWNLCLVNLCVTNMKQIAEKDCQDISRILNLSKDMADEEPNINSHLPLNSIFGEQNSVPSPFSLSLQQGDQQTDEEGEDQFRSQAKCDACDVMVPLFAIEAHRRFHSHG
ncbi:unnamed protein product [Blumeria hordei]|uniref:UmuC domain-containing protein n=1 Tax=Blumeria hordei TaxID=2867405 RepID=A0A383UTK1_BLUHO|nr:unnamed protein product [Blumeria hordei]